MTNHSPTVYNHRQRWFALGYGVVVHTLFAAAVMWMASGIYTGFRIGQGPFHGGAAIAANIFLLLQFPIAHSLLLSSRGRRWLATIMPMHLGAPLATTTFAGIASLQLILCFAAWSPLHTEIFALPNWLRDEMTVLYAASWLLLIQSMREAGTGLQTGSTGWRSIWKNAPVQYPPLPVDKPLHRIIRHPIYASFALILWTSPEFSIEKVVFALVWTFYCIAGSKLKELRLLRFHPAAYREYIKKVPFWIPHLRHRHGGPSPARASSALDAEIAIIGGGPVGLLLANLLGKAGRRVLLLESGTGTLTRSMAIGITPPSLDILARLGLDRTFIARGVRVTRANVWENGAPAFALDFAGADSYPYILTLPQSETVHLLRENLAQFPSVTLLQHQQVQQLSQNESGVIISAHDRQKGEEQQWTATYAVACDGAHSAVRERLQFNVRAYSYAPFFSMADFVDRSGLGDEAHLFFGLERPVESFPLPGGKRRWIVRSGWNGVSDLHESIPAVVARLTGIKLEDGDQIDQSSFRPSWKLVDSYYRGRVVLCGDAAHVMSPIGGQGMNTGFADADFLARAMDAILGRRGSADAWLSAYDRKRRRAFRVAAMRAAAGMALGVAHGTVASTWRGFALRLLMRMHGANTYLARWFTMRSLPAATRQYESALRHIKGATTHP